MRLALQTLADELRRLKAAGIKTVPVPDETLAALRQVVLVRREHISAAQEPSSPEPSPEPPTILLQLPIIISRTPLLSSLCP